MAYHLQPGEPVPAGIQRILHEEIEDAVRQLTGQGVKNRDEAIHEARKSVKKIRGVLRLMRPELGTIYRAENTRFRDIGHLLSEFRDAGAMIETFDALQARFPDEMGSALSSIRGGLLVRKEHAEHREDIQMTLRRVAAALRRSAKRVERWPLAANGFAALAPGLEATFRGGRKMLARVREDPLPELFHEWRKRVKDHWYHVRLLESYWNGAIHAYERSLKELETWLGDDHNLVVLHEKVTAEPGFYGAVPEIALFATLIGRYHGELRENALTLGKRIYADKPRRFTKKMRRMWDVCKAVLSAHSAQG